MNSPQYQPISDLLLDGKEWNWIFKDEHGKETPIVSCIVFEEKGIIEVRAKPHIVLPENNEKAPKTSKTTKKKS